MSTKRSYDVIHSEGGVPIKAWTRGVPIEEAAAKQLANVARMPFIHQWVAAMPDVHWGIGATVGSVIPTIGAIIPAAVGVDIGCGMIAVRTRFRAEDVAADRGAAHAAIARAVPLSAGHYNRLLAPTAQPRITRLERTTGVEQAERV